MGHAKNNKWFIAFKKRGEDLYNLEGLTIIEPEPDTYEADPFIIKHKGRTYLLFELYNYEKGVIAFREIFPDGSYTKPVVVLNRPWHLSFPALFEENDEVYMTPEEGQSGKLTIYKSVKFPYAWEGVSVVAEGPFADPILYKDGGTYTVLATLANNELRIFRSESLNGPWAEDNRGATDLRAAGWPYMEFGELIRPVQECHIHYGRAILFQRMLNLTTIRTIEPDWYPNLSGTHTFNFNEDYVVIDGRVPYGS